MDDDTQRVLWHTPTEYSPLRHGPPYLPGLPYEPLKLSSEQKADVRTFVKQASGAPSAIPVNSIGSLGGSPLENLLSYLQVLALVHQTSHWSTFGPHFYEDHLLFERLYNESIPFIDELAEKAIGAAEVHRISPMRQAHGMYLILSALGESPSPEGMILKSLEAEVICVQAITQVITALEDSGDLSHGISNMLEGIADKHEGFVYLLRQRSQRPPAYVAYKYDRG